MSEVNSKELTGILNLRKEKAKKDMQKKQCIIYQNNQIETKKMLLAV